jgi:rubrerythrin
MENKSMKGTRTETNLLKSFAGESQARNRYTYFASVARKEGFIQIATIFEETADNEKEHAKRMFNYLEGGPLEITATYPAGRICTTAENLVSAAAGENEEWTMLYPGFAKVAREEGFLAVAMMYEAIVIAEKQHEKRYLALLDNVKNNEVFKKTTPVKWRCANCGYIHEGTEPPEVCPACLHERKHFEILAENW